jgi:hypothetical protein
MSDLAIATNIYKSRQDVTLAEGTVIGSHRGDNIRAVNGDPTAEASATPGRFRFEAPKPR